MQADEPPDQPLNGRSTFGCNQFQDQVLPDKTVLLIRAQVWQCCGGLLYAKYGTVCISGPLGQSIDIGGDDVAVGDGYV